MTREEQIIKASQIYAKHQQKPFMDGAMWADRHSQNIWHDAKGDDLPEIGREVIVLCDDGYGGYKVCFGHRPDPKDWIGKPISYGKNGWNIPNIMWWLDCDLPNWEEQQ